MEGERLSCAYCDVEYNSDWWVETNLPNDVWLKISPRLDGGGVLCPSCISSRLILAGYGQQSVPCAFVGTSPLRSVPNGDDGLVLMWALKHLAALKAERAIHDASSEREYAQHLADYKKARKLAIAAYDAIPASLR